MRKYIYYLSLSIGLINSILANTADHLIFSKICIAPNEAQFVEIYNPTENSINLNEPGDGAYYLTDGTNSNSSKYYYNITTGDNYWSESASDFFIQFPENTIIEAGSYLIISMHDDVIYNSYYNSNPDTSLEAIAGGDDTYYELSALSILSPAESLILFKWDGVSNTVQDVDYFLWGNNSFAIDKTGISGYLDDTPVSNQVFIETSNDHYYYNRKSNVETDEILNGNGITGHNETSENFVSSFEIVINPGLVFGCTDESAANYNSEATINDGSCFTATHTIEEIVTGSEEGFTATIIGKVKSFADIRPSNGPQVIVLEDENGFQIDGVVWDWDVLLSGVGYMFDPYNPSVYIVGVTGSVGTYNGSFQFTIALEDDIYLYDTYSPQGNLIEDSNNTITKAEIVTAPYVLIPSLGERLDFHYSFPSNSRVIIRILDLNGLFITSLVDRYYPVGGTVERYEDSSDWDGRDHLGQVVAPGTYLIHIEASNFQSGSTTFDVAPIVVGAHQ